MAQIPKGSKGCLYINQQVRDCAIHFFNFSTDPVFIQVDLGLGDLRHQSGPFAALHFGGSLALGFRGQVRCWGGAWRRKTG